MRKEEIAALVRLVQHMQKLQREIKEPNTSDNVTSEEVLNILSILWEWTPRATYRIPHKHVLECFVGMFRGFPKREYCYLSAEKVVQILKDGSEKCVANKKLPDIKFSINPNTIDAKEFYEEGKWNYRPTPLVSLLFGMYCNSN